MVLDAQLVKMLKGNIPRYELLRKTVPGIDEVLLASPEKLVRFSWTNHHIDWWISKTTTVGKLRKLLENCTYDERRNCWPIEIPGDYDDEGGRIENIFSVGSDEYMVYVLETGHQI